MQKGQITETVATESKPTKRCFIPALQGESPTGYYGYAGKPLTEQDVANLKAKGVKFEPYDQGGDLMPDGVRLKKPRFRSDVIKKKLEGRQVKESGIDTDQDTLQEEYNKLPEPRPDFFQWAFERDQSKLYGILVKTARMPHSSGSERIKAISTILEFAKSKPKTQLEVSSANDQIPEYSIEDVMKMTLSEYGITWEEFQERFGDVQPKKFN